MYNSLYFERLYDLKDTESVTEYLNEVKNAL